MPEPLTTWFCDSCQEPITELNTALLAWDEDEDGRAREFLIVHKNMNGRQCDPQQSRSPRFSSSNELEECVGPNGLTELLSLLSPGPLAGEQDGFPRVANFDQFVDVVRRLHTPWYEEARRRFDDESVRERYDVNEVYPYQSEALRRIALR